MLRILWTLLLATGLAAPLFTYPIYALVVFTFAILWRHLFPSPKPDPEVLLLPTEKPYLAALKPLENPETVYGEHCPTCWDEFDATKLPTKLACGHVFCNEDILDWIKSGKNTCPVCKKVLFQQAMFQGNDAIAEKVHKARMCLVVISLLIVLLRQISCFIIRLQDPIHWTWQFLNPVYYLTGYGGIVSTLNASTMVLAEIAQLYATYHGYRTYGPEWFKVFWGHWWWYLSAVPISVWQLFHDVEKCRPLARVAWGICRWKWYGSSGSFLYYGAKVVSSNAERDPDLDVRVMAAWDKDGNQIV